MKWNEEYFRKSFKKIYQKNSLNSAFYTHFEKLGSYRKPSTDLQGESVGWFLWLEH